MRHYISHFDTERAVMTRKLIMLIVLFFAFVPTAQAETLDYFGGDGNFWLEACERDVLKETICPAFVYGLRGGNEMSSDYYKVPRKRHLYCAPDNVSLRQSVDVFVNYLKANLEARQNTARVLFVLAMREAFPC